MAKQSAIIDTCVILSDPEVIERANAIGYPILTDVILGELDYNKKNNDVAFEVRKFFRNMSIDSQNLTETPDGIKILEGDLLTKFSYAGKSVFILNREKYRSRGNNDSKIREVAKDYNFQFVTRDKANKIAADAEGVSAHFWTKSKPINRSKSATSREKKQTIKKFSLAKKPRELNDEVLDVTPLPAEGDKAYFSNRKTAVTLLKKLASGGEGIVYATDNEGSVAKVYHKTHITKSRRDKLELMLSKPVSHPSICWPKTILVNSSGEFCGYLMPKADGLILQTSVFTPALLKRKLSHWNRANLVDLALKFAEAVTYLNERNILIGDINPMNVLVSQDGKQIKVVDCDSFQIEDFPCPVGTVNFTAPDIQGKDYKSFLRQKKHEQFALATMLFMILLPGKPPYSQQGGSSQADNIRSGEFPYPFGSEFRSQNVASGSWRYIWSHLPFLIKGAFHSVFREKKTIEPTEWVSLLKRYASEIRKGWHTIEMFPTNLKVSAKDAIQRTCDTEGCDNTFDVHKDFEKKIKSQGKGLYCESCRRQFELERLARESDVSSPEQKTRLKPKIQKPKKSTYNLRTSKTRKTKSSGDDISMIWALGFIAFVGWLLYKLGWYVIPIAIGIYLLVKFFGRTNK